MRDGRRVQTEEPLKETVIDDDVSVSMKLEAYPNRDSTVFMDRFGMGDCHTFIRGTYRFQGFSSVSLLSSFFFENLISKQILTCLDYFELP